MSAPLRWSQNEVEANCRKAARGRGLPWGLAEEAGRAARWLSEQGLPGPRCMATLLSRRDPLACEGPGPAGAAGLSARHGALLCPIVIGTVLSDRAPAPRYPAIGPIHCPVLLLPFLAALERPVTLRWAAVAVGVHGRGLWVTGARAALLCDSCESVSIAPGLPGGDPWNTWQSHAVSRATAAILNALAERTFAPATEQSRHAGAGGAED